MKSPRNRGLFYFLEKVEIIEETEKDITDLYPRFLLGAILCFITAWILMFFRIYNPLEE